MPNWTDENGVSHFMCQRPGCCGNPWKTAAEIDQEDEMARGYRDEDEFEDPFADFDRDDAGPRTKRRGGFRGRGRDEDEGVEIPNVEVIRETGQAILVRGKGLSSDPFGMEDRTEEGWFPISQLHTRCEIRHPGDKGTLVITTWMAEKRGLR